MTTEAPAPRLAVPETLDPGILAGFDPRAIVTDLEGATMGTAWRVRLALPSACDPQPVADAIQARLDGLVHQISHWEESSLLCEFNRADAGHWLTLPEDFASIMGCGLDIAGRSSGAFSPALGRLTDLWGLGPRPPRGTPTDEAIVEALASSNWRHLAFEVGHARLRQPGGVWLDLSGIGKGYAADAVADRLAELNLRHCLVEIGGECVGRGLRPDGEPWWVELETPQGFTASPMRVALSQLAIATSGNYVRGAHTLDPRTGKLPLDGATAVSVIHNSCMAADAWASALSVAGHEEARQLASRENLAVRLLRHDGEEWISSALSRMLAA